MNVSTKELRIQPGKIIAQVETGEEITVTFRGKPLAKIVPFQQSVVGEEDPGVFGMWKDHDESGSVEDQVRNLRKGRQF